MPDRHATFPHRRRPVRSKTAQPHTARSQTARSRPVAGAPFDPVSLFAEPIGCVASPPGDGLPVSQTLYRTTDGRYVIRTCLQRGGDQACDVMIYADEAALREALSDADLDRALLAAAGLDQDQG